MGVIFKATDAYESGGTNTYRTFASINRGSNPPILTVEYSSTAASISLDKSSATLYLNDTLLLTATTTPSGSTVSWSSSNTNVATVSTSGVVTIKLLGQTNITATYGSLDIYRNIYNCLFNEFYGINCDIVLNKITEI